MHSLTALAAIFAFPLLTLAAPQVSAAAACSTVTAPTPSQTSELQTFRQFYLRTTDATSQPDHFNNLYLEGYHTGPGYTDAVLATEPSSNWAAYLNGTNLQLALNPNGGWGLNMENAGYMYASWDPVTINAARNPLGSGNFSIAETGLQWGSPFFGGFMACDWVHNMPQLFWYNKPSARNATIPSNCAFVHLMPEYIS